MYATSISQKDHLWQPNCLCTEIMIFPVTVEEKRSFRCFQGSNQTKQTQRAGFKQGGPFPWTSSPALEIQENPNFYIQIKPQTFARCCKWSSTEAVWQWQGDLHRLCPKCISLLRDKHVPWRHCWMDSSFHISVVLLFRNGSIFLTLSPRTEQEHLWCSKTNLFPETLLDQILGCGQFLGIYCTLQSDDHQGNDNAQHVTLCMVRGNLEDPYIYLHNQLVWLFGP